jgi:bacterial/archaeal transporter family protein
VIVAATYKPNEFAKVTREGWLFLIGSGLATGLYWLCYFRALQLGPASKVAPIDKLSVVFVIVLAFLFLGETLSPLKLLGGGLITAGAIILALTR